MPAADVHDVWVNRKQRLQGQLGTFLRQYGRKRTPGHDPNDRRYRRKLEREIKRMDPRDLDELMNRDAEGTEPD
jgi:hypothetical protein